MPLDKREAFVGKWFARGCENEDPFDAFFSLWLSLATAAERYRSMSGSWRGLSDNDGIKVSNYFRAHQREVLDVFRDNRDSMVKLAQRRGTEHGNPIVDTRNPQLREKLSRLSAHYLRNEPIEDIVHVAAVAELLNAIRNNIFHGGKIYDDRNDLELLALVNPLLQAVLRKCEPEIIRE